MNYQDPELRKALAGEYVLGTLHGLARRRFERLLTHNRLLKKEVTLWEEKLNALNNIKPIQPPKRVWRAIEKEITLSGEETKTLTQRLNFWKGLSALTACASVALVVVSLMLFTESKTTLFSPNLVALVTNKESQPLWLINADTDNHWLEIEAINVNRTTPSKEYELWLLPNKEQASSGQGPVSLGLLPQSGSQRIALTQKVLLSGAAGIAVSLEPRGGSTTGSPTGPVLYQSLFTPR